MNFLNKYFTRKKPESKQRPAEQPYPAEKYSPRREKKLTLEAVQQARMLTLPNRGKIMQCGEPDWIAAFKWYNRHVNIGQHDLGMGCYPCYVKVYVALEAAQKSQIK